MLVPPTSIPANEARGFASLPTFLLEDERLTGHDVLVLLALSSWLGGDSLYPSHATIARRAHVSVDTVTRALKHLRELGFVQWDNRRREDGGKTSNTYHLDLLPIPQGAASPTADSGIPYRQETDEVTKREVTKRRGGAPAPDVPIPDDFTPHEGHRKQAERRGLDLEDEVQRFTLFARERGRLARDWDAAFERWLLDSRPRQRLDDTDNGPGWGWEA